jgi:hypothetical protein
MRDADESPSHQMKTKVFGIVRYSILTDNSKESPWKLGETLPFDKLQKELFGETRLMQRGFFFEHFTLPSIESNLRDWCELRLLVFTSEILPEWHKAFLSDLKTRFPFMEIHLLGTSVDDLKNAITRIIHDAVDPDEFYCSFRIDDDDALSRCWLDELKPFLTKSFEGIAVSFPLGYSGFFDLTKRLIVMYGETYVPMAASGLCLLSTTQSRYKHIHDDLAGHMRTDKVSPVLLLSKQHCYFRVLHCFGDVYFNKSSEQAMRRTKSKMHAAASLSQILRDVNISPDLFQAVSDPRGKSFQERVRGMLRRTYHLLKGRR